LEITSGIDDQRYEVHELEDGKLMVEPWPFRPDQFTVNVSDASFHLSLNRVDSTAVLEEPKVCGLS
jgi:hypothetical protein